MLLVSVSPDWFDFEFNKSIAESTLFEIFGKLSFTLGLFFIEFNFANVFSKFSSLYFGVLVLCVTDAA